MTITASWSPVSMVEPPVGAPIDANGNLTSDGPRTFEWDARNQLVAVTVGTRRSEFTYNGFRRRVRIVEKENGVTQSDTNVVWCESDICEERAADGTTVTRRAFVYAEQVAGAARFFAMDHIGSVTDVTDAASTGVGRYAFDPWGRRTLAAGSDVTTVGFTGHRSFGASLWLTLNRAYDADLGRWLSEDPIGLSDGPNLYAYVENRVTVWIDPLGLQKCCDELQQRRKRLHDILDQIDAGREPSGFGIGGYTVCAGNTPDPLDTDYIRKTVGPCLTECVIAHENRHARQCRRFGAEHLGRNSRSMERSAYLDELGCVIRKIQSSGCEDCK
jgi:RHS repeat-associated protein